MRLRAAMAAGCRWRFWPRRRRGRGNIHAERGAPGGLPGRCRPRADLLCLHACHGFKIVAQQGQTRQQWDDTLNWMTQNGTACRRSTVICARSCLIIWKPTYPAAESAGRLEKSVQRAVRAAWTRGDERSYLVVHTAAKRRPSPSCDPITVDRRYAGGLLHRRPVGAQSRPGGGPVQLQDGDDHQAERPEHGDIAEYAGQKGRQFVRHTAQCSPHNQPPNQPETVVFGWILA